MGNVSAVKGEKMLKNAAYFKKNGDIQHLPPLWEIIDNDFSRSQQWWQGGYGLRWEHEENLIELFPGVPLSAYPTPYGAGVVIVGLPDFPSPNDAAIYNVDGSFRCHLKAPKPLSWHLPGYIHSPEQIAKISPEGFWQVGWRTNDFWEICTWEAPYLMWANIGLHCDVYERRYFDPDTGEFDLEHFHTGRY